MRAYNFPVTIRPARGDVLARIVLNGRFRAEDILENYPRNVLQTFLGGALGVDVAYRAAEGNAVEITSPAFANLDDADRAIMLNLVDFGQDFESDRSHTVKELVLFVPAHGAQDVPGLHKAVRMATMKARVAFDEVLARTGPPDEFAFERWPNELHERFYYGSDLSAVADLPEAVSRLCEDLHAVIMWSGCLVERDLIWAVENGYSATSVEIEREGRRLHYAMERPSADPALVIARLRSLAQKRFDTVLQVEEFYIAEAD